VGAATERCLGRDLSLSALLFNNLRKTTPHLLYLTETRFMINEYGYRDLGEHYPWIIRRESDRDDYRECFVALVA